MTRKAFVERDGLVSFGEAGGRWARRHGFAEITELGICDPARWRELVGDDFADDGEPVRLEAGTLLISVRDEGAATRFAYGGDGLIAALNVAAGRDVVRRVEVRIQS